MKNLWAATFLITTLFGPGNDVQAQTRETHERLLVPIVMIDDGEAPGAFGSRWVIRLVGHNASNETIYVAQSGCFLAACPSDTIGPNSTVTNLASFFLLPASRSGTGSFLYVGRPHNNSVTFNLRVQDLSRQALTWGTELPVVRESEVFMDPLRLLNIPTDARFRVAIRVYDFDPGSTDRYVRLRVFGAVNQTLVETMVALVPVLGWQDLPGYAQFTDLVGTFPQLAASESIRVEIIPVTEGLRFWAFASVTNNETQHVTTVTPQ